MRYSEALAALPRLASGYVPPASGQIKLNQNESPFTLTPDERALLLAELGRVALHRYPDPAQSALTEAIAGAAGVRPEMVLAGSGANALLELVIRATCNPGDPVVTPAPTYHLYAHFAAMNRAELTSVAWGQSLALPVAELLAAAGARARLLLLCRPNNPTGHVVPARDVLELADRFPGLVAVDEAYYDFCRDTLAPFVGNLGNLVVVRTLSKAYGGAGVRVGYLVAPPDVAAALRRMQLPYAVSALSQAAGAFLLGRPAMMERQRAAILAGREDLARRLQGIPGVRTLPSEANFILARTDFSADALDAELRGQGIFVRNVHWDDRHLRISVGTPDEHARLAEAMRGFVAAR